MIQELKVLVPDILDEVDETNLIRLSDYIRRMRTATQKNPQNPSINIECYHHALYALAHQKRMYKEGVNVQVKTRAGAQV